VVCHHFGTTKTRCKRRCQLKSSLIRRFWQVRMVAYCRWTQFLWLLSA
jgi:hypothetical protein